MTGRDAAIRISPREAEVLDALGARRSNAEIAAALHISVRTVESHVSSLLRKLGVPDRAALIAAVPGENVAVPGPPVTGLPGARTRFVGRDAERTAVRAAMELSRLVTLVGPGGVGKTRLAAAVAEAAGTALPWRRVFVDLVPVRDDLVAPAVARVLDVTQRPPQAPEETIAERLGDGEILLVLDNCEHLLDAVAGLTERLLAACPGTRILATSRERLGVPGERVIPVRPLPAASDAVDLFLDRAQAVDPQFAASRATVAEICNRLDGMPLAIELAAARTAALGVEGVLMGLDDALRLLSGGRSADERHRSVRSVMEWSYRLLDERERALFRRLATFVGAFDLDGVAALAGDGDRPAVMDTLARLVEKSLVVYQRGDRDRWRVLTTIRAFALDQFAAEERREATQRHLRWAVATVDRLVDGLSDHSGSRWGDDFDAVSDDLRAALSAAPADDPLAHRLARGLARSAYARQLLVEALRRYRQAAELASTPAEAGDDLRDAAYCTLITTAHGIDAFDLMVRAADRYRLAGDGNAEAIALARAVEWPCRHPAYYSEEIPYGRLRGLFDRAVAAGDPTDPTVRACLDTAHAWIARSAKFDPDPQLSHRAVAAARTTGDPILLSAALDLLTTVMERNREPRRARVLNDERLALLPATDRTEVSHAVEIIDMHWMGGAVALATGDLPAALAIGRQVLEDRLLGGNRPMVLSQPIPALVFSGDLDRAMLYADEMWTSWRRGGHPPAGWMAPAAAATALAYGLRGARGQFRLWHERAVDVARTPDGRTRPLASLAFVDARLAVHTGDFNAAATIVESAFLEFHGSRYVAYAQAAGAELAVAAGLPDAGERIAAAAPAAEGNDWAAACLARAAWRRNGDADALDEALRLWNRIGARIELACTLLSVPRRAGEAEAVLAAAGVTVPPPVPGAAQRP